MFLSNPIWLWGLMGLLIPFGIHLLSRKEGKVIRIGSLRHLSESTTQQFKSIRFNEILLFILRVIIIGLLVLWLSELFMNKGFTEKKWALLDPELKESKQALALLDSLRSKGYEARYFNSGFNPVGSYTETIDRDTWGVLSELKKENLTDAIVITSLRYSDFKGFRESNPENLKWIQVPITKSYSSTIVAIRIPNDSLRLIEMESNSTSSSFTEQRIFWPASSVYFKNGSDSIKIENTDLTIAIKYDPNFSNDFQIIQSAFDAIKYNYKVNWSIIDYDPAQNQADWLIWLSVYPLPTDFKGNSISIKASNETKMLLQTSKNAWLITQRLSKENVLENHFAVELARILITENIERIQKFDQRVMPEQMAWATPSADLNKSTAFNRMDHWLLILLILFILSERGLAYWRGA